MIPKQTFLAQFSRLTRWLSRNSPSPFLGEREGAREHRTRTPTARRPRTDMRRNAHVRLDRASGHRSGAGARTCPAPSTLFLATSKLSLINGPISQVTYR
eukprot:1852572-Pleurochrysis_carterae.AAC.4